VLIANDLQYGRMMIKDFDLKRLGLILISAALLTECRAAERRLKVLTTFFPVYCFTVNVVGDFADVQNLLSGGSSLHDYQLSPSDAKKIEEADLVVANGLGAEAFLERVAGARAKVVRISDGLKEELIYEAGRINPHIWLDPKLVSHGVTNILNALQKMDSANSRAYAKNAADYILRLNALDDEIERKTATLENVAFFTYHSAFPYFTRRYGLKRVGVIEAIPEVPPTPRELSKIHRTIREEKARALFTSPETPIRMAKQIAKDSGMKLGRLDPLETGELGATAYEEAMRRNAENLVTTLE